ncbi:hypothetical protein FAIPA1_120031 [Frankia sp. AiPs1]
MPSKADRRIRGENDHVDCRCHWSFRIGPGCRRRRSGGLPAPASLFAPFIIDPWPIAGGRRPRAVRMGFPGIALTYGEGSAEAAHGLCTMPKEVGRADLVEPWGWSCGKGREGFPWSGPAGLTAPIERPRRLLLPVDCG